MKKTRIAVCVLLFSFCFIAFSPFLEETAYAEDYGSLMYFSFFQQDDIIRDNVSDVFDIIGYIFGQHAYTWTEVYDGYGDDTNRNNILSKADSFEANHDGVAFLHYGHWWTTSIPKAVYVNGHPVATVYIDHWTYYPSNYNQTGILVKDCDLFPHTDQGEHYFVFLWTCVNGYGVDGDAGHYDYGIDDPPVYREGTGAVGMPYAFTHEDDLQFDGYIYPDTSSSYCWLGFNGTSKAINEECEYTEGKTYEYFLCDFYYHVLNTGEDLTIHDALDYTCDDIWGTTFEYSPIRSYLGWNPFNETFDIPSGLIVWGNSNLKFPK